LAALDEADSEARHLLLAHEVLDQRLQLTPVTFALRPGGNANGDHRDSNQDKPRQKFLNQVRDIIIVLLFGVAAFKDVTQDSPRSPGTCSANKIAHQTRETSRRSTLRR